MATNAGLSFILHFLAGALQPGSGYRFCRSCTVTKVNFSFFFHKLGGPGMTGPLASSNSGFDSRVQLFKFFQAIAHIQEGSPVGITKCQAIGIENVYSFRLFFHDTWPFEI